MFPRSQIHGIDVETPPAEVLRLVAESPFTRLPVYRGSLDDVVGVLHTKDVLLRQLEEGAAPATVADLVRPIISVPAQASADRVLVLLRERRVQIALVTDRGTMVGLITLENVLSEVFGTVTDELKGARGPRRGRGRGPIGPGGRPNGADRAKRPGAAPAERGRPGERGER